jgi:ubiquinone/menaquinone biosynthesis C-methylase UbiE
MSWFASWRRSRRPKNLIMDTSDGDYETVVGKRHLRNLPYMLPKDVGEIKRLDFQQFLLRYGLQGNYLAPLRNPLSILDVGCGTGRWAVELAVQYPNANVVGTDIVPTEEFTLGYGVDAVPDNYLFVKGNVLERLPFEANSFDFVHQRLLITAIPIDKWSHVITELMRVTRPGGWVELQECGVPLDAPGQPYPQLWQAWIDFCKTRGVDFTLGNRIGTMLQQGGLQHVQQREVIFPMGKYGGRVGTMSATDCLAVGATMKGAVTAAKIMSPDQYDRLYQATQQEFQQPVSQAMLPFYIAYGQKRG